MVSLKKIFVFASFIAFVLVLWLGFSNANVATEVKYSEIDKAELKLILNKFEDKYGYYSRYSKVNWYNAMMGNTISEISIQSSNVRHAKELAKDRLIVKIKIQSLIKMSQEKTFVVDTSETPFLLTEVMAFD